MMVMLRPGVLPAISPASPVRTIWCAWTSFGPRLANASRAVWQDTAPDDPLLPFAPDSDSLVRGPKTFQVMHA
jgi:hypothetical protein